MLYCMFYIFNSSTLYTPDKNQCKSVFNCWLVNKCISDISNYNKKISVTIPEKNSLRGPPSSTADSPEKVTLIFFSGE